MGSDIWMGVRGHEKWIRAMSPRTPFQPVGWSATTQARNGRLSGRHSRVTHMEYEFSWPTIDVARAREIKNLYYGVDGDGLIHWIDPMIENQLPAHWSMPSLGITDGEPIYGRIRPTAVATAANNKGLPAISARFSTQPSAPKKWAYIPIPPGYTAHVGLHSSSVSTAAAIGIARYFNGEEEVGAASTPLNPIGASSNTRFNHTFPRISGATGIGIRLAPGETIGGTTLQNTGTIAAIMVAVLPNGQSPQTGTGFSIGGGANGCRIFDPPVESPINSLYGRTSLSVVMKEVGP